MNEADIKTKLDIYADYQRHRDSLEADKKALLEDVKLPAEVEAIVSSGLKRMREVEDSFQPVVNEFNDQVSLELAALVVPEEIKEALAEIDRKRAEILEKRTVHNELILKQVIDQKSAIQEEVEAQTREVYASLARRKEEIEAEFSGKAEAVDENIKKLAEEIRADVKEVGFTVNGLYYQAVYVKAKKSWIPQRLEVYVEKHPDIKECYTVGEPSISLKRIG
jgi:cysteinyl-tRNA synthetase